MKYRVTWFNKKSGIVHSEGTYLLHNKSATITKLLDYYRNDLIEGDDCCIMINPDNFPHSSYKLTKEE